MMDPGSRVTRGGIIPFCKVNTHHFRILLGLKKNSRKYYGDFGGGIKKYETITEGITREVKEESGDLFDLNIEKMMDERLVPILLYKTKDRSFPTYYVELLVPIAFDETLPEKFISLSIEHEHKYLRWIDIKKITKCELLFS